MKLLKSNSFGLAILACAVVLSAVFAAQGGLAGGFETTGTMKENAYRGLCRMPDGGELAVDDVDPMIGTGGSGHCFPGPCRPFGFVQPSPDTGNGSWRYCAGYNFEDKAVRRFSQTHLNGTGQAGLGDVGLLPFVGVVPDDLTRLAFPFAKSNETARLGSYAVVSDAGVKVEIAAGRRMARYRIAFPPSVPAGVLLDFPYGLYRERGYLDDLTTSCRVERVSARRFEGANHSEVFASRDVFYVVEWSCDAECVAELPRKPGDRGPAYALRFAPGATVELSIALSARSPEGARRNLAAERAKTLDELVSETRREWQGVLSRVRCPADASGDVRRSAATAVYHLCCQPNDVSDVGEAPRYSTFSFWDTFRDAHPLYERLVPERVDGFVRSLLAHHRAWGYLPQWELWGREASGMIGSHGVPVVVDAYEHGFRGFDAEEAFAAVRATLRDSRRPGKSRTYPRRTDWEVLDRYGYYPYDVTPNESVSRTLECCYDDYRAYEFAAKLGKPDDAAFFLRRSWGFTNLFDRATGCFRPKDSRGRWLADFNPAGLSRHFTEGSPLQWSWYVLHQPQWLVENLGGKAAFEARLDAFFAGALFPDSPRGTSQDITGMIGDYAHGNEPCHHVVDLYRLIGREDKARSLERRICRELYRPTPDGLCGNDDCGQMSAWYLRHAGFSFQGAPESFPGDYLENKWRRDSGDPSTGLNGPALRAELEKLMPAWARESSWTMAKAKAFCFLCDKTAIDVPDRDWFPAFAFWTRHTPKLHPLQPIIERRDREVTEKLLPPSTPRPVWPSWYGYHDYDHSAPDWDAIVPLGFTGLAERLARHDDGGEYYKARRLAMDGVFRFLDRLIACGEKKLNAGCEAERDMLPQQVASLKRLRKGPPATALDVLEFIYLYWSMCEKFEVVQVRTLGNLDVILAPYYRADLAAGRTTEDAFRRQLKHFWWQWGSIDNYWGQPVYFGGTKADGATEYNETSKILLEVHDELALPTPKVHLKMGKSTPEWVWKKSLEMMRRQRPLTFVGEEPHARVIRSMGYDAEAARTFMLWGCYEWAIRDSANDTNAGAVNLLKPVADLLAEAASGRFAAASFNDFKAAYFASVGKNVDAARDFALENEKFLEMINPAMLPSVATEYSVKTGRDVYQGGTAHGNNSAIWMIGFGTTVDALLAVKELVYERKSLSLAALGGVMAADWKGHEDLRQRMLRSPRKWGNNDPEANALARELQKSVAGRVNGRPNGRGGVFKACGHTARWHYVLAEQTGATPDGRKKGEEMSKNISPTMGADTEGATALIESVANLDACDFPGDFPLDVALLAKSVPGEKGLAVMRTLIERYFANGGLVIQFNVHDAATLKDAQAHPEKYRNLQVRVCGWNVRWNDIPKVEQDKFILRQELQESCK